MNLSEVYLIESDSVEALSKLINDKISSEFGWQLDGQVQIYQADNKTMYLQRLIRNKPEYSVETISSSGCPNSVCALH